MTQALKSATTLGALVVLLVLAAIWGWSSLTEPLPKLAAAPPCTETAVKAGNTVTTDEVTVSVLNAGKRAGLAGRTMDELLAQGFHEGTSANAPSGTDVGYAQIWTDDIESPAVALLKSHLQRSKVVDGVDLTELGTVGVVLVVGDRFDAVGDGAQEVQATTDTTICSPAS
ncbi:LytR C-terminal domain-containing protein [Nocardioides sp.]|uniref:LytR C-terminal domain-containing protein n=1 Tax=Nocardioides sp. TaxID=35761 RepID=UPI0039E6B66E